MWRVEDEGRRSEIGAVEVPVEASVEVRCFPAWTRRISDVGADVRKERRWRSVGIVVSEGTVSGMVSPDSSLTKIWKFSDGDEDVDVEEAFDDEREIRMFGESVGDYG